MKFNFKSLLLVSVQVLNLAILNAAEKAVLGNCVLHLRSNDVVQNMKNLYDVGIKRSSVAAYASGSAKEALANEDALREQGIHIVMVKNPTEEDVLLLKQHGYSYGPMWVTNHQPIRTVEQYIDSIPETVMSGSKKNEKKSAYRRKVNVSKKNDLGIKVEIGDFSENFYNEWYQIYKETVLSRENGADAAGENFAKPDGASKGNFSDLKTVSLRDRKGKLIGGYVLQSIEVGNEKILKVRFAAFKEGAFEQGVTFEKLNLSYRAYDETIQWALKQGAYNTISYGSDPNIYANDLSTPGLHRFKRELGFAPTYWTAGNPFFAQSRLIKILNNEHVGDFNMQYVFDGNSPTSQMSLQHEGNFPPNFSLMPISTEGTTVPK